MRWRHVLCCGSLSCNLAFLSPPSFAPQRLLGAPNAASLTGPCRPHRVSVAATATSVPGQGSNDVEDAEGEPIAEPGPGEQADREGEDEDQAMEAIITEESAMLGEPAVSQGGDDDTRVRRRRLREKLLDAIEANQSKEKKGGVMGRIFRPSAREDAEILNTARSLASLCFEESPCEGFASRTSPISGTWLLAWSNAPDVRRLDLAPGIDIGKIYQEVSDDGTEIINTIQLRPSFTPMLFGDTASEIKITLKAEVAGRKKMKRRLQKVEVKPVAVGGVDTSFLPPIGLLLPSFLPQPRGGFTTTYVDSKLWVLSTGKNLFIHTRAQGLNT